MINAGGLSEAVWTGDEKNDTFWVFCGTQGYSEGIENSIFPGAESNKVCSLSKITHNR